MIKGAERKKNWFYSSFTINKTTLLLKSFFACIALLYVFCITRQQIQMDFSQRIISLAPSITETLFAMGLEERIAGVTTFCVYPPQARTKEKIGSYTDINLEKVMMMKPDLIILQKEHEKSLQFFNRYKFKTLVVDYTSINGMCSTFAKIGKECGVPSKADSLIALFARQDTLVVKGAFKPRVLLCVGRNAPGSGDVSGVFIAGATTYYNDLIVSAGGVNVFTGKTPQYPQLSKEGIVALAPDIIFDLAPSMTGSECNSLVNDWDVLRMVPAVKNSDVYCISNDYSTIPGPRAALLLQDFIRILVPIIARHE